MYFIIIIIIVNIFCVHLMCVDIAVVVIWGGGRSDFSDNSSGSDVIIMEFQSKINVDH